MNRKKRGGKKGFTLVELIVVLVILSVISAIALPTYIGYVDHQKEKQCAINLKRLASYLDDELVTNPGATMQDVINRHPDITCPGNGTYYASADNAAECTVHHDADAVVIVRKDGTVTAKVDSSAVIEEETPTEKQPESSELPDLPELPEPSVTVSVSPNPLNLKLGANVTDILTASVQEKDCTFSACSWTSADAGVASVSASGDYTANVTGLQKGSTRITCTATARTDAGEIVTATATVDVVVEADALPAMGEVLIAGTWNQDPLPVHMNSLKGVDVPAGGSWTCSSSNVITRSYDDYVQIYDGNQGGTYSFTYTKDGESSTVTARVVYAVTGFHSTHSQVFDMYLDDQETLTAYYQPENTTDGPVIWNCSDNSVLHFSTGGIKNSEVTVTAASVGTATLTASMRSEYQSWMQGRDVYETYTWTITVKPKKITQTILEPNPLTLYVGKTGQLNVRFLPAQGVDTDGLVYDFSADNTNIISVSPDGVVTGKQAGSTTVRVSVKKGGTQVENGFTSAEVIVSEDPNVAQIQGEKFDVTPWENLWEYLQKNEGGAVEEPFAHAIYARTYYETWGAQVRQILVLKPDAVFDSGEDYTQMDPEEFFQKYQDRFIVVNTDTCIDISSNANGYFWAGVGALAKKDGELYVCVKQVTDGNSSAWTEDYLNEYFVKIS